ncbi:hypothetical protein Aeh1ORF131c [Aeromonas phage Aeh1]|uniref:PARP catalytic domain-containing protein n=1 Tax=Aeromonas phage Aeh1 TaxID=2880362 RepID=Q76YV0_9CAUD|nr:hypothetical protein Aeh1p141 [Aeromonas phage Aeh1]AAQ17796.1 hypothetical protein Aeh1ORF131c [Aeromonas phage Aeh1]
MLTTKQLFERQEEEDYQRFLAENTLYDAANKATFVDDETAIMNAFMFNFIGILGSFNAARQMNHLSSLRKYERYFKSDGQLMLKNIGDDNNNISLVLKLMTDKKMFISDAKVSEMTRFLVKCKAGVINTVDDDIVRGWVANIKSTALMNLHPKLRDLMNKFKTGAISLIDTSKELRRVIKKFPEAGEDLWTVSMYVKYARLAGVSTVTVGTAAGAGVTSNTGDDDDDDKNDNLAQVHASPDVDDVADDVAPVVQDEPVAVPVQPDYQTYDHDAGLLQFISKQIEECVNTSTGLKGLYGLAQTAYPIVSKYGEMVTGFEFDLNDEAQSEMHDKYRTRYSATITQLSEMGKRISHYMLGDNSNSVYAIEEAMELKNVEFLRKHISFFRGLKEKYSILGDEIGYTGYQTMAMAFSNMKTDPTCWLFGFNSIDVAFEMTNGKIGQDMVNHYKGTNGNSIVIGIMGNMREMSPMIRQMYFNCLLEVIKPAYVYMMSYSSYLTDGYKELLFTGPFADMIGWDQVVNYVTDKYKDFYPPYRWSAWNDQSKLTMCRYGMEFLLNPDNKTNADFGFVNLHWSKVFALDDEEFKNVMLKVNDAYKTSVEFPLERMDTADVIMIAKCVIRALEIGVIFPNRVNEMAVNMVPSMKQRVKDALDAYITKDTSAGVPWEEQERALLSAIFIHGEKDVKAGAEYVMSKIQGTPNSYGKTRILLMSNRGTMPEHRQKIFLGAYSVLGKNLDLSSLGITSSKFDNLYSAFLKYYDFEGEDAVEFMKLEVKNGFKFFNAENGKSISVRDHKQGMQQSLVDIMTDAVETDPTVTDLFFDNLETYYRGKVRDQLAAIKFVYGQVLEGPINLFDKLDRRRVKQMFEFNEINPTELVKQAKLKLGKNEKFTDYIKRVEAEAAKGDGVVPKVKATNDNITNEQKYLIGKHLIDNYYAGKHGNVYPLILRSMTVSFPDGEFKKFMQEQIDAGKLEQVVPCFHGTGGIAANMILRYGFKIIPSKDASVVGRMLGDGIYFSNKIDKILQYVGNSGYGRQAGTKGYVFEMESILGQPIKDYRSAGVPNATSKSNVISPEWAVFNPEKQLRILKCYEVELNRHDKFKAYQAEMKGTLEESKTMKFGEMLTEAKRSSVQDYIVYSFRDGELPRWKNGRLEYVEPKKVDFPAGIKIEGGNEDDGYVRVYIPAKRTEYREYSACKKLKGKELKDYLKLTEQL